MAENVERFIPEGSWFRDYMALWPTAEAPKSYILFSAMAMLGSALGRSVYFDQDIHRVYPLLNVLLIGPSGIGKTTSIHMAEDLLIRPLPRDLEVYIVGGKATKEALHDDLMANNRALIIASELANMFSKEKYNEGMIPYFTDLLDLRPTSVRTKVGGLKTILDPSVSVIGGSTREWLQEQMPSSAGAGGFLPRFLVVKEDHKAQRIADPKRALSVAKLAQLQEDRDRAQLEFQYLIRSYKGIGAIDFADYSASDAYSYWYQTFTPESGHLAPFAARAGVHVLRLAVLLSASRHGAGIETADIEGAIGLYNYAHSKLQEVVVPMSPQGKLLAKVLEAIGEGEMSLMGIRRAMRNYCASLEVDRLVQSLIESGDISKLTHEKETVFKRNARRN